MKPAQFFLERHFWSLGKKYIAGLDEVGRGAWAGPLVVGAVVFSSTCQFPDKLYDSKVLNPDKRKYLAGRIREYALAYKIIEIEVSAIDQVGVGQACQLAFKKALEAFEFKPDYVLVDGFMITGLQQKKQLAIIKGDRLSASIAAASILAKVHRDELMNKLANFYPNYGFESNKGYGTGSHRLSLQRYGYSKIHRMSFKNISALSNHEGTG